MKPIRLFNFVQMDNGIHWLFLLAVFVSTLLRAFQKAARPLNELARGFPIAGSGPPVVTPAGVATLSELGTAGESEKKKNSASILVSDRCSLDSFGVSRRPEESFG